MSRKLLWLFAVISLSGFLCFYHFNVKPFDLSDWFMFAVDFLSNFLAIILFAVLVSFLLAVIPLKNKSYWQRYGYFFPLGITVISVLYLMFFCATGPHYHSIKAKDGISCASIKDGNFKVLYLKIERKGDVQFQTNLKTGERTEFNVKWLSDCEYELSRDGKVMKVKIVSADENGYECFTLMHGLTSPLQKVVRVK